MGAPTRVETSLADGEVRVEVFGSGDFSISQSSVSVDADVTTVRVGDLRLRATREAWTLDFKGKPHAGGRWERDD